MSDHKFVVTGRRGGRVDQSVESFLAAVRIAVAEGPCWVKISQTVPAGFRGRLEAIGATVIVDPDLHLVGARLYSQDPS